MIYFAVRYTGYTTYEKPLNIHKILEPIENSSLGQIYLAILSGIEQFIRRYLNFNEKQTISPSFEIRLQITQTKNNFL